MSDDLIRKCAEYYFPELHSTGRKRCVDAMNMYIRAIASRRAQEDAAAPTERRVMERRYLPIRKGISKDRRQAAPIAAAAQDEELTPDDLAEQLRSIAVMELRGSKTAAAVVRKAADRIAALTAERDAAARDIFWLSSHCRAIGMTRKADITNDWPRAEIRDICLYTIDLKARAEKAEAELTNVKHAGLMEANRADAAEQEVARLSERLNIRAGNCLLHDRLGGESGAPCEALQDARAELARLTADAKPVAWLWKHFLNENGLKVNSGLSFDKVEPTNDALFDGRVRTEVTPLYARPASPPVPVEPTEITWQEINAAVDAIDWPLPNMHGVFKKVDQENAVRQMFAMLAASKGAE